MKDLERLPRPPLPPPPLTTHDVVSAAEGHKENTASVESNHSLPLERGLRLCHGPDSETLWNPSDFNRNLTHSRRFRIGAQIITMLQAWTSKVRVTIQKKMMWNSNKPLMLIFKNYKFWNCNLQRKTSFVQGLLLACQWFRGTHKSQNEHADVIFFRRCICASKTRCWRCKELITNHSPDYSKASVQNLVLEQSLALTDSASCPTWWVHGVSAQEAPILRSDEINIC